MTLRQAQGRRLIVGLTGGIGSGKSTVAGLFAKLGAGIVDTDVISHTLTRPGGEAMEDIRTSFGRDYLSKDGALDRAKMRRLVFSDAAAKQRLENILHPLIRSHAQTQIRQLQDRPYLIVVVPLLPESPAFRQLVQRVLVVDCTEDTQVARVIGRSNMAENEVRSIIAGQTSRAGRLQLADDIIHNEGGLDDLAVQVTNLHEYYVKIQNSN